MDKKSVAVIVDVCHLQGGAYKAAKHCSVEYKKTYNVYLVCTNVMKNGIRDEEAIILKTNHEVEKFVNSHNLSCVHYFKALKHWRYPSIFSRFVKASSKVTNRKTIFLTTVVQRPSNPSTILTPFEIVHSDKIVFIDKTAYNDRLYDFIPPQKKDMRYLCSNSTPTYAIYKKTAYTVCDTIIFGRGSTLNKIPKDTVDIYDRINISQNKQFIIVGVPEDDNWMRRSYSNRKDLYLYPIQNLLEYAEKISVCDIFLYYLPVNAYSSVDGSLGVAMSLGIPCIVYGPDAPKERIIHGVNGYIAETKEDVVKYAELLASDSKLREKIGTMGARMPLGNYEIEGTWMEYHTNLIKKLLVKNEKVQFNMPIRKVIKIYSIKSFCFIQTIIRMTITKIKKL